MAKQRGPMFDFSRHQGESDAQMARRIQDQLELEIDRNETQLELHRIQRTLYGTLLPGMAKWEPSSAPDLELVVKRASRAMRLNWPQLREHLAGDLATLQRWQSETAERVQAQLVDQPTVHAPKLIGYAEDQKFYDPNLSECGLSVASGVAIAQHVSQVTCPICKGGKGLRLPKMERRKRR